MRIERTSEIPAQPVESKLFTSADVNRQALASESKDFNIGLVNFGKGVRNKFHTHSSDQVLIVTAGTGIVATEKEERTVAVGDIVLIPAGEKHWHGATKGSKFSHIAITRAGSILTQIEE